MEVIWCGWVKDEQHDKLWGIIEASGALYNFWCARGAKMQFKAVDTVKYSHKENKGYRSISMNELVRIYPNFIQEAEMALTFDLMADRVR